MSTEGAALLNANLHQRHKLDTGHYFAPYSVVQYHKCDTKNCPCNTLLACTFRRGECKKPYFATIKTDGDSLDYCEHHYNSWKLYHEAVSETQSDDDDDDSDDQK